MIVHTNSPERLPGWARAYHLTDRAITALAVSDTLVAVGTELVQQQAIVSLW